MAFPGDRHPVAPLAPDRLDRPPSSATTAIDEDGRPRPRRPPHRPAHRRWKKVGSNGSPSCRAKLCSTAQSSSSRSGVRARHSRWWRSSWVRVSQASSPPVEVRDSPGPARRRIRGTGRPGSGPLGATPGALGQRDALAQGVDLGAHRDAAPCAARRRSRRCPRRNSRADFVGHPADHGLEIGEAHASGSSPS